MSDLIWPVLEDRDTVRQAVHLGAAWSWVLAAIAALTAILTGNFLVLLMSALYVIAGVGLWKGSLAAALVAFVLCILQTMAVLASLPLIWAIVTPFAFLGLMNGVRGAASMRRWESGFSAMPRDQ